MAGNGHNRYGRTFRGWVEIAAARGQGRRGITVRDLLTLLPGDIIQTAKAADTPIVIQTEGRNRFLARAGRHKDNRAVKIIGPAVDDDKL